VGPRSGEQRGVLEKNILASSQELLDPAGRRVRVLEEREALRIAKEADQALGRIYQKALTLGVCPLRYLRNLASLSLEEQGVLARSQVAVVGAGGLGGQILVLLARMGVGHLVVLDGDVFEESNLNRQALSRSADLGKNKAQRAGEALGAINPAVEVRIHGERLTHENAAHLLAGSQVAVDALDNVADRLLLQETAAHLQIPLVHGAVAGFEGQVMTILPGDQGLYTLYGQAKSDDPKARPEAILGVPAPTPALVATLQTMEVLKLLLGRGRILRHRLMHVDLESGHMEEFLFPE